MEALIEVVKKVNIKYVKVEVAVRYDDEDIPYDFPLRDGDMWKALIEVDTGKIIDWPEGEAANMHMKICDEGSYYLLDENKEVVLSIEENYVPNKIIPGEFGDYIELRINNQGIVANWPKHPNINEFYNEEG